MFVLGMILGGLLGILLMALVKNGAMAEKQSLIDASRHSLANAEDKIFERNEVIKIQREENRKLKNRVKDLENHVEMLVNNLPEETKKLYVPDYQSENV